MNFFFHDKFFPPVHLRLKYKDRGNLSNHDVFFIHEKIFPPVHLRLKYDDRGNFFNHDVFEKK